MGQGGRLSVGDGLSAGGLDVVAPTVTVAVVSFNTRNLLLRCLQSLEPEANAGLADVWVVDNDSIDVSAEAARDQAPWAQVIDAGANVGYGRAVNSVARWTRSEWLLAANADVAFESGALEALIAGTEAGRVGCVAPRLVLPGGAIQHSVHPLPTVPLTLAFNLGLHRLSYGFGERLCLEGWWDPERARDVPWAIGACLLLRREAFEDAGGFDEDQWMYAEDLDLQWRMRWRGWRTRYAPAARVLHESAAATGHAFGDERAGRFMAATYTMLLHRRGAARMWATAAINIAGAAVRVVGTAPLGWRFGRWRSATRRNWLWLKAHLEGIRGLASRGATR